MFSNKTVLSFSLAALLTVSTVPAFACYSEDGGASNDANCIDKFTLLPENDSNRPPEPPKDENGNPLPPPDASSNGPKHGPQGEGETPPEPPKDENGKPLPPPDGFRHGQNNNYPVVFVNFAQEPF